MSDRPDLLAGKDLQGGWTWQGIDRTGRFAALTDYRDLRRPSVDGPSRGSLVLDALDHGPDLLDTGRYEVSDLRFGTIGPLHYHSNVTQANEPLAEGFHALSDHLLDTPWPKVVSAEQASRRAVEVDLPETSTLFDLLRDATTAAATDLPDTGLPEDRDLRVQDPELKGGIRLGSHSSGQYHVTFGTSLALNQQRLAQASQRHT